VSTNEITTNDAKKLLVWVQLIVASVVANHSSLKNLVRNTEVSSSTLALLTLRQVDC
jgi:hypothetical protein